MANRHWEFLVKEILGDLNDKLALRHGTSHWFEVPETSHDWDVIFNVIKDSSGNNLGESYQSAWVRPSLIGPKDDDVRPLKTKVKWTRENKIDQKDERALMQEVDKILGNPFQKEIEKITPKKTLSFKTKRILSKLISSNDLYDSNLIKESIKYLQKIENSKKLEDDQVKQIEVQDSYGYFSDLKRDPKTSIFGIFCESVANNIKTDNITIPKIYDVLSRLNRMLLDYLDILYRDSDFKLKVLNYINNDLMSFFGVYSGDGSEKVVEDFGVKMPNVLYDLSQGELINSLKNNIKLLNLLKDEIYSLDLEYEEEVDEETPNFVEDTDNDFFDEIEPEEEIPEENITEENNEEDQEEELDEDVDELLPTEE